ncbi:MAG TPA: acetate--CoA ligase family protein [Spirochaetota bacterium]|nr:acetate--CoA ligase family protein [Spirochaetota bacterium]HOM86592.1 acetate--CoA ligase family protein [Spirochaetota bacterium]HOR92544.1 acetate--CoA ligase family protein [Spirochaetota bacterium]HOT18650.1 acetate--CoA ligase family protein [Spirochaetota bacterium]HPD03867.1 acetate--CoA ligase family protein [Spirochaetota bacterium]
MREILNQAIAKRQKALSEFDSKQLMKMAGIPVSRNYLAKSKEEALDYAQKLGFPVVLKGCSDTLTHKTELGMVKLKLKTKEDVANAYDEITGKGIPLDGVLVQEWLDGDNREFVLGSIKDPQFGPCVMFGLGGVFTEALQDVSFRVAPITSIDAYEMMDELRTKKLLGPFRGSPAVDKEMLARALVGLSELINTYEEIAEIDINPIIINGDKPVAVDALVILKQ